MPRGYVISRVDMANPDAYAHDGAAATKAIAAPPRRQAARVWRAQ